MKGYIVRKGDRWYAVVYEGLDPVIGQGAATLASSRNRPRRSGTTGSSARRGDERQ